MTPSKGPNRPNCLESATYSPKKYGQGSGVLHDPKPLVLGFPGIRGLRLGLFGLRN